MTYSVKSDKRVDKYLESLSKDTSLRIIDKLKQLKQNPFHYLEHYEGPYYKLRIGDYRALIEIDFENKILFIRVLDKRGRVYKKN